MVIVRYLYENPLKPQFNSFRILGKFDKPLQELYTFFRAQALKDIEKQSDTEKDVMLAKSELDVHSYIEPLAGIFWIQTDIFMYEGVDPEVYPRSSIVDEFGLWKLDNMSPELEKEYRESGKILFPGLDSDEYDVFIGI